MIKGRAIIPWPKTEKWANRLIIALVFLPMIFALLSGFSCKYHSTLDEYELARLIASIAFPMSGILTFILTQALTLRKDSERTSGCNESLVVLYTSMCKIAGLTIMECAIAGLTSLHYYKSGGDEWLTGALCLMLSIFVLLITNAILFYDYAICRKPINRSKKEIPDKVWEYDRAN